MDSHDRPRPSVPAVPARAAAPRLPAYDPPAGRAGDDEAPAATVNVVRVAVRAVARHWWQILGLWVVGAGALVYLVNARVKPQYESASLLRVEPSLRDLFGTGAAGENFEPYLETQVQLIASPNVLSAALAEPKVAALPTFRDSADPEGELRRQLAVSVVPRSYLIRVGMTSPSAADAAAAVNAVVDAYLKTTEEWADGTTRKQILNLEKYQRELKNQAEEKEATWLLLASKANVEVQPSEAPLGGPAGNNLPVATRSRATVEEYKRVRDELFRANVALSEAEAVLSLRESEAAGAAGDPSSARRSARLLEQAFRADPEAAAVEARVEKARQVYDDASRRSRSASDPAVVAALRHLEALAAKYQDLFDAKRDVLAAKLEAEGVKGARPPEAALDQARESVQRLRATRASYERLLAKLDVVNKQEGSDAVKIAIVREDLAGFKEMLKAVDKRLEQLRFDAKGQARISRISEARPNLIPASDNRFKYMVASPAALLGCLLAVFVALELRVGRVCDLDELSRLLPVEVFAVPPLPGPRPESGRRGARERETRLQEFLQTLDHLRVALCGEEAPGGVGRCLLVTSATAGEGKTTLTAQLSACCAKAGVSTLVIDADLRRATLSRILNEESTPGLSDVLQGELEPDAAPVALPDAGFHFLAAGAPGRDPSWLLKNQRIGPMLARYRQTYDVVIIDTPPCSRCPTP